jgi:penicillin-binding protein 1C
VIRSSIDASLQRTLEQLAARSVTPLPREVQVAMLAVDLRTREVRARVGAADQNRAGGFIDMTRAVRSPGSALKPFLYAIAFDENIAAPETLVRDAPRAFGGYLPENFDRRFHGEVRLEDALRHSLNLPAVETLDHIGAGRFQAALERAGAHPLMPRRALAEPGLALALGGVGITMEQMVGLYAALGDEGRARPILDEPANAYAFSSRFVRPETAKRVVDILASSPSPAGRTPANLAQNAPRVAFKTGTSYGFRDSWSFGIAGNYAIGVWVGRPDGAPRPGVTGREGALPILFDAFDLIGLPPEPNPINPEPARRSAPPALAQLDHGESDLSILFPPQNAEVLVLDYGPRSRGLSLAARGGVPPFTWYAEGEPVATEITSGRAIWRPTAPGFHDVSVVDSAGHTARVRVRIRNSG